MSYSWHWQHWLNSIPMYILTSLSWPSQSIWEEFCSKQKRCLVEQNHIPHKHNIGVMGSPAQLDFDLEMLKCPYPFSGWYKNSLYGCTVLSDDMIYAWKYFYWLMKGMLNCKVELSSFSNSNQSAYSTLDWVKNSQSGFERVAYKHSWDDKSNFD